MCLCILYGLNLQTFTFFAQTDPIHPNDMLFEFAILCLYTIKKNLNKSLVNI